MGEKWLKESNFRARTAGTVRNAMALSRNAGFHLMILQLPEKCPAIFGAYTNFFWVSRSRVRAERKPKGDCSRTSTRNAGAGRDVSLENGRPSDEKGKGLLIREPINTATLPLFFVVIKVFIQSFAMLNSCARLVMGITKSQHLVLHQSSRLSFLAFPPRLNGLINPLRSPTPSIDLCRLLPSDIRGAGGSAAGAGAETTQRHGGPSARIRGATAASVPAQGVQSGTIWSPRSRPHFTLS
ncbi:hypothetical protein B0H13DRAFT_1922516 [Mycena leptocephala]|nr:hypothetical protein B0H13DRAFT_1922516 [Mycena leptocephala]